MQLRPCERQGNLAQRAQRPLSQPLPPFGIAVALVAAKLVIYQLLYGNLCHSGRAQGMLLEARTSRKRIDSGSCLLSKSLILL